MAKSLVAAGSKMAPVVAPALEIVNILANHSANMSKIKNDYRLAKDEMQKRYNIEKQAMINDLKRFNALLDAEKKRFNQAHFERVEILKTVNNLSKSMRKIKDPQIVEQMRLAIDKLMDSFDKSLDSSVGYMGKSNAGLIAR